MPKSFNHATINSIVALLQLRGQENPHKIAYSFLENGEKLEEQLSYKQLQLQVQQIATCLQTHQVAGQRVLLLYPPGLAYIKAFLGCLYAKAVAVPAYPPNPMQLERTLPRLMAIIHDCKPTIVLTTSPILTMAQYAMSELYNELDHLAWIATDALDETDYPASGWQQPPVNRDTVAFLQYTSGSTAAPKGVIITHGNLLHNETLIASGFQLTPETVAVGWLPLYHDMGLIGNVLHALCVGFHIVLMSPLDFLQKPLRWLQAISDYQAAASGGPNFAYELCLRKTTPEERAVLQLEQWTLAFNGAEPLREETMLRFAKAFAPAGFRLQAFYPCYGLAEGTLIVSGADKKAEPVVKTLDATALTQNQVRFVEANEANASRVVGSGRVLGDQQVKIVHPHTAVVCAPDEVGEIWISGDSVAQGYWQNESQTAAIFNASINNEGAFLRTGDLGFLHNGELFITGRLKDVIIIRGRNYYPQDIELVVEKSFADFRPGCTAAFAIDHDNEEQLVVVQEVRHTDIDTDKAIQAIQQAVSEIFGLRVHAIQLLAPRTIPKTSSGKIQRHAAQSGYKAGTLSVIADYTTPLKSETSPSLHKESDLPVPAPSKPLSLIQKMLEAVTVPAQKEAIIVVYLKEKLSEFMSISESEIAVDQPISRLGLDSLTAVELKYEIETALKTDISLEYLFTGPTLQELSHTLVHSEAQEDDDLLPPSPTTGLLPTTYGQRALWYLHQLNPHSHAYHLTITLKIHTSLDLDLLAKALYRLQERHTALRTTFIDRDGELLQNVAATQDKFPLTTITLSEDETIDTALRTHMTQPFHLTNGPLWRVVYLTDTSNQQILLIVMHHIISDLLSLAIFTKELGSIYTSLVQNTAVSLEPLTTHYADFAYWQQQQFTGDRETTLRTYWLENLGDSTAPLPLPTDFPRPKYQTDHAADHSFTLTSDLSTKIKQLAKENDTTPYTLLLTSLHLLLNHYTGQKQIRIGSPTQGRPHALFSSLIGYFVNTIVLQARIDEADTFAALLTQMRQTTTAAIAHQDYPFALLVEQLQPERDPSHSPLIQVLFSYQQAPRLYEQGTAYFALGLESQPMSLGALTVSAYPTPITSIQFDLNIVVAELDEQFHVSWQYNRDLFRPETMVQMTKSWVQLLTAVLHQPHRSLTTLSALTPSGQQQLTALNQTRSTFPTLSLPELVTRQASQTPDQVAVVYQEQTITYRTLNQKANQLATYLQEKGVTTETAVALALPRTPDTLIAMLAVLKAGGMYIPLDPGYPHERLQYMLTDSASQHLITDSHLAAAVVTDNIRPINLDTLWPTLASYPTDDLTTTIHPQQLAYTIYTSGSTGRPKGVQILHQAVTNFLHSMAHTPGLTSDDYLTAVTTISFDIAVLELFLPLIQGAAVEIIPQAMSQDAFALAQHLTKKTTIMQATPATWKMLIEAGWQGHPNLKILSGGEALPPTLADQLLTRGASVWNMYGPTETTVWSSVQPLTPDTPFVPIGHPIANTQLHILNEHLLPVPIGVPGRLFIGGDGVARGYWQRPLLTASRFIPDPFSHKPGARLYHTGDLVRLHTNGLLQYLGREDHQLKIRGFRIEPGEVEATLRQYPGIQQAVVMPTADQDALIATLETKNPPAITTLQQFLQQRLPDYMIPHQYQFLPQFPLTPNGKIDRKAMNMQATTLQTEPDKLVPPGTPTEQKLYKIWAAVLEKQSFSIHDLFFTLGGHSLLATQIVSRLNQTFQINLPLRLFFENATIAQLAHLIDRQTSDITLTPITPTIPPPSQIPLSFAQQQLWLWDQLNPNDPTYNIRVAVRLQGPLDLDLLEAAFNDVVVRHESLRTRFDLTGTTSIQIIEPHLTLPIQQMDIQKSADPEKAAQQAIIAETLRPFDLTQLPLVRLLLLNLAPDDAILVVTMHHIIADGWSLGLLIHEIAHLYTTRLQGRPATLPDLPLQYRDFTLWQRTHLQGDTLQQLRDYWQTQLQSPRAIMDVPTDFTRPSQRDTTGATYFFALPLDLQTAIHALSQQMHTTTFVTLLTAFNVLLHSYTQETDILVGIGSANRNRLEIESLIGYFVNQLVLRTDLSGSPSFAQLIERVHEVQLQAILHQDLPFETLLETINPRRDLSRTPLFQAKMVWQPPLQIDTIGEVQLSLLDIDNGTAKFDILLNVRETPNGLWGALEYSTQLFQENTIRGMMNDWQLILQAGTADTTISLSTLNQQLQRQRKARQKAQTDARRSRRQQTFKKSRRRGIRIKSQAENMDGSSSKPSPTET